MEFYELKPQNQAQKDALELYYQAQLLNSFTELKEQQTRKTELSEFQKRMIIGSTVLVGTGLLALGMWVLLKYIKVLLKYRQMIAYVNQIIALGYFDLTSASSLAWCAEYPNFTGLLFSKILNRNFPKAVALAYYSPPYSDYFNDNNLQEGAVYLAKMEEYSNFHGDATAQEIICGAWGHGVGVDDCIEDCPIPYVPDTGAIVQESLSAAAMGVFLMSSVFFMVTSGGTAALVLFAGAAVGATVGATTSVMQKNKALAQCESLADMNCRIDVEEQC